MKRGRKLVKRRKKDKNDVIFNICDLQGSAYRMCRLKQKWAKKIRPVGEKQNGIKIRSSP